MKVLLVYKYLFYCLFKKLERQDFNFLSSSKAEITLAALQIYFLGLVDYKLNKLIGIDVTGLFGKYVKMALLGAPPLLFNFILLGLNNRYKDTIKHFDGMTNEERKILNSALTKYIVVLSMALIILLLL